MRKLITFLLVVALLLALYPVSNSIVQAADPIMLIDEVKPGMTGMVKTTIKGTEISQFDVEVIAALKDVLFGSADIIVVKGSGDIINETGGLVFGMSGSPVYLDGKVAGAISAVYFPDPTIGFAIAIEDMLKISEKEENVSTTKEITLASPVEIKDRTFSKAIIAPNQKQASEFFAKSGADTMVFYPLPIPLSYSGISSPEALQKLNEFAEDHNYQLVSAGENEIFVSKAQTQALEPGAPLGVGLMLGDLQLGSIGTVTYIDGDKIWGFGHPLFGLGEVNLPMTTGYIYNTLPGHLFKIGTKQGTLAEIVGTISQDRSTGVYGRLGDGPTMIPIIATASAKDRGVSSSLRVNFAPRLLVFPKYRLGDIPAVEVMHRAIDRKGGGTSRVVASVNATTLNKPVVREDMFYSSWDIVSSSIEPLNRVFRLLIGNDFRPVDITAINFKAELEQTRCTAEIQNADLVSIATGQTGVLARITPFSYETEEAKEVFVPISLPEDMPSGVAKIVVTYGRPWEYSTGDSLEEAIANFENADHYNELVVKFNPPEGEETIKFKVTTDWVLEGYVKFRKKV